MIINFFSETIYFINLVFVLCTNCQLNKIAIIIKKISNVIPIERELKIQNTHNIVKLQNL